MKFTIGYDKRDTDLLHQYWNEIIDTQKWSEGKFTQLFEEKWSTYNDLTSLAFSSWAGGAMAALEYHKVRGKVVLCPSNTFMATPLATVNAGASVEFVDCNKEDLCINIEDLKEKINKYDPVAVWVVHIGGHIAFQIEEIAKLCKEKGIVLLEDCAHAHGAAWHNKKAGIWGDAGVYSFYATKTISTGEGGMLVSRNKDLIEFARAYRNWGKFDYKVE
ncbi:MAG: DegT/DnrJ/EryC1/StrS family aminotransferase, partial [Spirochaetes bacterium]|nr:DegT/DnrJ/EryC1/StrS family aminotransferase [Spirochaetota bacterium]